MHLKFIDLFDSQSHHLHIFQANQMFFCRYCEQSAAGQSSQWISPKYYSFFLRDKIIMKNAPRMLLETVPALFLFFSYLSWEEYWWIQHRALYIHRAITLSPLPSVALKKCWSVTDILLCRSRQVKPFSHSRCEKDHEVKSSGCRYHSANSKETFCNWGTCAADEE